MTTVLGKSQVTGAEGAVETDLSDTRVQFMSLFICLMTKPEAGVTRDQPTIAHPLECARLYILWYETPDRTPPNSKPTWQLIASVKRYYNIANHSADLHETAMIFVMNVK